MKEQLSFLKGHDGTVITDTFFEEQLSCTGIVVLQDFILTNVANVNTFCDIKNKELRGKNQDPFHIIRKELKSKVIGKLKGHHHKREKETQNKSINTNG